MEYLYPYDLGMYTDKEPYFFYKKGDLFHLSAFDKN